MADIRAISLKNKQDIEYKDEKTDEKRKLRLWQQSQLLAAVSLSPKILKKYLLGNRVINAP